MNAASYLESLPRFATGAAASYKPGFDRIRALLDLFDHPERSFPVILVGGTNGKGSTASFLSALLTASGRRAGLHTSPHLLDVTERMRVDGAPAPTTWLDEAVHTFRSSMMDIGPSFYEATLALSLYYFAHRNIDVAVIEIGLGGRLDAANALDPAVSVITSIGLDHTEILGDTTRAIAAEKAGIMRTGVPLVLGPVDARARAVFESRATELGTPLHESHASRDVGEQPVRYEQPDDDEHPASDEQPASDEHPAADEQPASDEHPAAKSARTTPSVTLSGADGDRVAVRPGLAGTHQLTNAALAADAFAALTGGPPTAAELSRGLENVVELSGIRGRYEILQSKPALVVDTAHNAEGVAATLTTFRRAHHSENNSLIVLGLMRDKSVNRIARALLKDGARVLVCGFDSPRAMDPGELKMRLEAYGVPVEAVASSISAIISKHAHERTDVLVLGSHYLAGECIRWWESHRPGMVSS